MDNVVYLFYTRTINGQSKAMYVERTYWHNTNTCTLLSILFNRIQRTICGFLSSRRQVFKIRLWTRTTNFKPVHFSSDPHHVFVYLAKVYQHHDPTHSHRCCYCSKRYWAEWEIAVAHPQRHELFCVSNYESAAGDNERGGHGEEHMGEYPRDVQTSQE